MRLNRSSNGCTQAGCNACGNNCQYNHQYFEYKPEVKITRTYSFDEASWGDGLLAPRMYFGQTDKR